MKNRYKAGADFERRVCDWYWMKRWHCIRSAGSHGLVDVLAFRQGEVILNTLRISGQWTRLEKEAFNELVKGNRFQGRYVWRGDKHDNFKIHFAEVG